MISVIIPLKFDPNIYWKLIENAKNSVKNQTYKDYELIIEYYKSNLSRARNRALERCKGELILMLDADDEIFPEYLEKTVKLINEFDIIATQGFTSDGIYKPLTGNIEENNQLLNCSLFKREIWEKYKFNERLWGYEDWDFWIKAIRNGYKIGVVNEPLVKIGDTPHSRNKIAIKDHELLKEICLK